MSNIHPVNVNRSAITDLVLRSGQKKLQSPDKSPFQKFCTLIKAYLHIAGQILSGNTASAETERAILNNDSHALLKQMEHCKVTCNDLDNEGKPILKDGRIMSVTVQVDDNYLTMDLHLNKEGITLTDTSPRTPANERDSFDLPWPPGLGHQQEPAALVSWLQSYLQGSGTTALQQPVSLAHLPPGYSPQKAGLLYHHPVTGGKEYAIDKCNSQITSIQTQGHGEGATISIRSDDVMDKDPASILKIPKNMPHASQTDILSCFETLVHDFNRCDDYKVVVNGHLFTGAELQKMVPIEELNRLANLTEEEKAADYPSHMQKCGALLEYLGMEVSHEAQFIGVHWLKTGFAVMQSVHQAMLAMESDTLAHVAPDSHEFKPAGMVNKKPVSAESYKRQSDLSGAITAVGKQDERWSIVQITDKGATITTQREFNDLPGKPTEGNVAVWQRKNDFYSMKSFINSAGVNLTWLDEKTDPRSVLPNLSINNTWSDIHVTLGEKIPITA